MCSQNSTNESSLKRELAELFEAALAAKLHFDIWRVLTNDVDHPKFVDVMGVYSEFFSLTISAHRAATVMALARFFDNKHVSIKTFTRKVSRVTGVDQKKLETLRDRIQQINPLITKVFILRNKVYGHTSEREDAFKAFKEADITPNDFRYLIEETLEVAGDAGKLINVTTGVELPPFFESAIQAVLIDLKRYRESGGELMETTGEPRHIA